jgi:hypothetical protein
MAMTPRIRKVTLTAHVTSSIGWFGAVAAFLVLAIAGLTSPDAQLARATYLAMGLTTWFAILPLAVVSLLSGVISSMGTNWGLVRHYWILVKLLITILITVLLLVHIQLVDLLASVAAKKVVLSADLGGLRIQMAAYGIATLLVLLVLTVLSVYKPQGMTRYGWRKQREERVPSQI